VATTSAKDRNAYLDDLFISSYRSKSLGDLPNKLVELRAKKAQGKRKAEANPVVAHDDTSVDVNVVVINFSDLSFNFSRVVGEEAIAGAAQHKEE